MEGFKPQQFSQINSQALNLLVNKLNLSSSLTKLRLILPGNPNATISMLNALLNLKDAIELELQVNLDLRILKSIIDSAHKFGKAVNCLRNLSKLSLVLDADLIYKANSMLGRPQKGIENFYFNYLLQTFKYCNSLGVLKLELPRNDWITYSILKAVESLDQLIELEVVVLIHHIHFFDNAREFLPTLSRTINNLPKLTTLRFTIDYMDKYTYETASFPSIPTHTKLLLSFIQDLKRIARLQLAIYKLDPKVITTLAAGFKDYVHTLKLTPSATSSWYTLIASTTDRAKSPSLEDREFNFNF
jgi:hypothetical protein